MTYVGVMRSDAALYDPIVPKQSKSKRGRKPGKGPRLPNPKEAVKKADGNRCGKGPWTWQTVKATAYGVTRTLQVVSFQALWPEVRGLLPILVLLVRDPQGKFEDKYLFTTDVHAELSWVISTFSRRWSIEVAFKASKQVMKIQAPQHWCQQSIEKLSPWVWLMQSVISLWYITAGHSLPQAQHRAAAFRRMGHGMVARPYAPHPPRNDPRRNNYHQVGHKGRPAPITRYLEKLPTSRHLTGLKSAKVQLHMVEAGDPSLVDLSRFVGNRKPTMGAIRLDEVARKLASGSL